LNTPIYTIGHSTRASEELVALLSQVAVGLLIDVRSIPRSRTNPQFNADVFPLTLREAGIGYRYIGALGGRRRRPRDAAPSPNTLWRNMAFRAYADYAATDSFRTGLAELCDLAGQHRCAIMCAEAVWWRCHRRIIADYLLARGIPVAHILGTGRVQAATLTPGAGPRADGTLVYAARDPEEGSEKK
jgi:uncharacterized protein (DUF488 family)